MLRLTRFLAAMAATAGLAGYSLAQTSSNITPATIPPFNATALAPGANQLLADKVAVSLRSNARLAAFHLEVICQDGVVLVRGTVKSEEQKKIALRAVLSVTGVTEVRDSVNLEGLAPISQVSQPGLATVAPPANLAPPMPVPATPALAPHAAPSSLANGTIPEPMAMGAGQMGMGGYDMCQPNMPNYAWPTYAPYNNYSRVAYPEYYPHDAFPFIGPTHPFPKVPTGWRSGKLEWNDGFWFFSKLGTKHDYWRLRFW